MLNYITRNKTALILLSLGTITGLFGLYQLISSSPTQAEKIEIVRASPTSTEANSNKVLPTHTVENHAAPSSEPPKTIKVDISGAVANPGVYDLPEKSRISDALQIVDGLDKSADIEWISKNLNMATELNDTDKIYIPYKSDNLSNIAASLSIIDQTVSAISKTPTPQIAGVTTTVLGYQPAQQKADPKSTPQATLANVEPSTNSKISINNASSTELESLSGIGPVTAKKIIDNRPYATLEELKEKKAVGNSLFEKISEHIIL
jgi:competence protein ComEA